MSAGNKVSIAERIVAPPVAFRSAAQEWRRKPEGRIAWFLAVCRRRTDKKPPKFLWKKSRSYNILYLRKGGFYDKHNC